MSTAPTPPIKGFLPSSLVEWEGLIASEVFLPGCNFRCPQCHNRALVLEPHSLPDVPLDDVLKHLREHRKWIDGVVVSGGEPTIHAGLPELLKILRGVGMRIKLDTNGSNPDVLQALLEQRLVDFVAMDVKAPLDARYSLVAGVEVDSDAIRRSIELVMAASVQYEFRTTVCPEFLKEEDVLEIARQLKGARRVVLQAFRPVDCLDKTLESVLPYSEEALRRMAERARRFVPGCVVRGEADDEGSTALRETR